MITGKGLDLLRQIDDREESFNKIFESLSESEINTVNSLLDKLRG
jgi:hypothetical protein